MLTVTVLRSLPPFAIGLARDLRVRWALEEAGLSYQVRTVQGEERQTPEYRRQQPFGQIPVLQDGERTLFESGAILLHLGERHPGLLPADPAERADALMWMFAALNSVEQHVAGLVQTIVFNGGEAWAIERRPALEAMARARLADVEAWLAGRDYLAGSFSVADILMTTVLRLLAATEVLDDFPVLRAYRDRCMARPAFRKALADHAAQYEAQPAAA
jgi:glutathione S-transferase